MRVAARRGPFVEHSTLVGFSILLVENGLGRTCDLQRVLEGAGAHVSQALTADDALRVAEETALSAAVLDYGRSTADGHIIARRLTVLGVPFVFCKEIRCKVSRKETWLHTPVLYRPIIGSELVETLRRLLQPATEMVAWGDTRSRCEAN